MSNKLRIGHSAWQPRVGIVLVSHSASLAEGTAELAGQVGGGTVTIATAGGTDDGRLGTSIDKVEPTRSGWPMGAPAW